LTLLLPGDKDAHEGKGLYREPNLVFDPDFIFHHLGSLWIELVQ
jgi:hypothetical protein